MTARALVLLSVGVLCGCASTIGERDALGNPKLERLDAAAYARLAPPRPAPLSVEDIERLSRDGVPPQQIIDRYHQSGSRLKLTEAQIDALRRHGVEPAVLDSIVRAETEAEKVDRITAEADREARERERRENDWRYRYDAPWADPHSYPYYWGPRVYPYLGYGWSHWSSGWYGGLSIGF